uniref:Uncharacterized protein n=1 Tax=Megaselia scalaris TaxID=36166 RepID=T1GWV8_MEGSC
MDTEFSDVANIKAEAESENKTVVDKNEEGLHTIMFQVEELEDPLASTVTPSISTTSEVETNFLQQEIKQEEPWEEELINIVDESNPETETSSNRSLSTIKTRSKTRQSQNPVKVNFNYRVLGAPNDSFILDVKRTGGVKAFSCEICSKII